MYFFEFLVFTCHLHHHLLHQNTTWFDSLVLVNLENDYQNSVCTCVCVVHNGMK